MISEPLFPAPAVVEVPLPEEPVVPEDRAVALLEAVVADVVMPDVSQRPARQQCVAMLAVAGDYVSGIVQKGDSVAGEMAWIQVVNYQKNA